METRAPVAHPVTGCVCPPQQTENVRRLAWSKGYVLVNLGGGTTGVVQTNDTDCHEHQRREYTQKEMAELVRMARLKPDRMPSAKLSNALIH